MLLNKYCLSCLIPLEVYAENTESELANELYIISGMEKQVKEFYNKFK